LSLRPQVQDASWRRGRRRRCPRSWRSWPARS